MRVTGRFTVALRFSRLYLPLPTSRIPPFLFQRQSHPPVKRATVLCQTFRPAYNRLPYVLLAERTLQLNIRNCVTLYLPPRDYLLLAEMLVL